MSDFCSRLAEFRAELTGDFIPAVEAARFVESMESNHRGEFDEWMRTNAVQFCTLQLSGMLRGERRVAASRALPRAFAEAAAADDSSSAISVFTTVYEVDPDHTRRPVAEMTGADHAFVAGRYTSTGNRALMLAAFHTAVSGKVKRRQTCDVFSEAEYRALYDSIVNPRTLAAAA